MATTRSRTTDTPKRRAKATTQPAPRRTRKAPAQVAARRPQLESVASSEMSFTPAIAREITHCSFAVVA